MSNNTDMPAATDQKPIKSNHSLLGVLSSLLPTMICLILVPGVPTLFLLTTQIGMIFVYCIGPVGLLVGLVPIFFGLRQKNSKKLFPAIGLVFTLMAFTLIAFMCLLALSVGYPFVCINDPAYCFK